MPSKNFEVLLGYNRLTKKEFIIDPVKYLCGCIEEDFQALTESILYMLVFDKERHGTTRNNS